ncbi:MAG: HypC/HybG/HupF family hydrogenase formation chaperone [bacterium]|nr:HypC/HybG/HupF family hydrogenase formation chaperone [bacterium]
MCLAIPGLVQRIQNGIAIVDFGGLTREIALDLVPDTQVGDYILAHAGFAIQKLDTQEAEEILSLFQDIERCFSNEPPNSI